MRLRKCERIQIRVRNLRMAGQSPCSLVRLRDALKVVSADQRNYEFRQSNVL